MKTYRMPVQQKSIDQPPHDPFIVASRALFLQLLEFCSPLVADGVIERNFFLHVEVVMAMVVRRDFARLLHEIEELGEAVP